MSKTKGLGFGGILVGLGVGWIVFDAIHVTNQFFGYFLVLIGALITVSSLIPRKKNGFNIGGLTRGLMIGLLVSLFTTSSFNPLIINWGYGDTWGNYRAEETRTLIGDLTENKAYLDVDNFNGQISVSTWTKNEYRININIRAKGSSDSDAEDNLDDINYELTETVVVGEKKLVLRHNIAHSKTNLYSVNIEVKLPSHIIISTNLDSSNGGITLKDIEGSEIRLITSNGPINFEEVTAEEIHASTSNGGVRGKIEAPITYISTSNGGIHLNIPCTTTGRYNLRTSNAGIGLDLSSSTTVGYNLDLSTSNGEIHLNLPKLDFSQNTKTSKEAITEDFSGKTVQIIIDAKTSNAGMNIGN
jgi:DUF4097 and DUF4098 domain-containing protein YvlB